MKHLNRLLLDDKPLIVLPSLAKEIGLNESIVLQQIHYWLQDSKHNIEGHKWIYNTYSEWEQQFPFWSNKTIRRTITKLENEGILITGNFNKLKIDKTKWYRINYPKLAVMSSPCGQSVPSSRSTCPHPSGQSDLTNNQRIPETTTDNTYSNEFEQFWTVYPRKVDKKKAAKSFKSVIKNHSIDSIVNGTKKYARQVQNTEKKFIKHPATFLNNESFLYGIEEDTNDTPIRTTNQFQEGDMLF